MVYSLGAFVKQQRIDKKISQEELAEGICTQSALSRFENGGQALKPEALTAILQSLGFSDSEISLLVRGKDVAYYHERFQLRQAYIIGDFETAKIILEKNKEIIPTLPPFYRQTFETVDILMKIRSGELSNSEALCRFEETIRLTHSGYTKDNLPSLLTYEDILILNNIALQYAEIGERDTTIKIFYHIKNFYDSMICDIEEALRTQPMILYNLSKYLGLSKRYSECISICEEGIKLAVETGRCSHLSETYYNLSWSLYHRNRPGDKEASLYYIKLAYYTACSVMKEDDIKWFAEVIKDRYNITMESLCDFP